MWLWRAHGALNKHRVDAIQERERDARSVPEMLEADVGEGAFRSLTTKNTTCDHCTTRVLTPLLTPLRAQYAETVGKRKQRNWLI